MSNGRFMALLGIGVLALLIFRGRLSWGREVAGSGGVVNGQPWIEAPQTRRGDPLRITIDEPLGSGGGDGPWWQDHGAWAG